MHWERRSSGGGDCYCGGGFLGGDWEQGQQRPTPWCSSRWRACMGERARLAIQPVSASDPAMLDARCSTKKKYSIESCPCSVFDGNRDRGRKGQEEITIVVVMLQRPL
jgi:hypothetical protein